MSRIYEYTTKTGVRFGLYERTNSTTDLPYALKRNGIIVCNIENIGDANREYHHQIREEECPF